MDQRESHVFHLFVSALVSVVAVAAGILLFVPKPAARSPDSTKALEEALDRRGREVDAMKKALDDLKLESDARATRIAALERRLDQAAKAGPPEEVAATTGDAGEAKPAEPAPEDAFARGMRELIRRQIKRGRDRFIDEVLHPTPESDERNAAQAERIAGQVSKNLELDERDTAAVTRVLKDVDTKRRQQLRRLFQSKSDPKEVTYPEVKQVLDDSFAEEDRQIEQTLPRDKADAYQKTATPYRDFAYTAAQAAFPTGTGAETPQQK
jgi:hypothetical protein